MTPSFSPTNLRFVSISPLSNSVLLGVAWPPADPPPEEWLDLYSTSNLVSGAWEAIGTVSAPSNAPGVEVEVPHSALVGGETNIAFFVAGTRTDTDGDGLADAYERLVSHTDPALADTDRDGLSDGEELSAGSDPFVRDSDMDGLVDGSDPSPLAVTPVDDLDGDGIPDAYEEHWFGSTNAVDELSPPSDGFSLAAKIACGISPNAPPPDMERPAPPFAVWKITDPFLAENTSLDGNIVYERAFPIGRTSTWQQYFISAAPTNAAAWSLDGASLETCGQSYHSSPTDDSLRLQLASAQTAELVVCIRATADTFGSQTPLYLIAYAPALAISNAVSGAQGGRRAYASVRAAADGAGRRVFHAEVDRSARPCLAAASTEELAAVPPLANSALAYDLVEETLVVPGAGVFDLCTSPVHEGTPRSGGGNDPGGDALALMSPSGGLKGGCAHCGKDLEWNPRTGVYSAFGSWPLDTPCLIESWNRTSDGEKTCTCEPSFDSGFDGPLPPFLSMSSEKEPDGSTTISVTLGDETVWSDNCSHSGPRGATSEMSVADGCPWPADECPCSEYESTALNSADFRIPLGRPAAGMVSGFLWLSTDEPLMVAPDSFRLKARADAAVSDTTGQDGVRRVVCGDVRGKTLEISAVQNGAEIVVKDTASGSLDHTWSVVNEYGDPSRIRFVKTSRLNNVMSDETYRHDGTGGGWTRADNVSGLVESFSKSDNLNMEGERTLVETRSSTAGGKVLSETVTTYSIIGSEGMARLRETERRELAHSDTWKVSTATWWDDPSHPGRHALAKLVKRAGEPWEYSAYDEDGRRTLRLRQLAGSSCALLENASPQTLADIPAGLVCEAVELSYAPLAGDDAADGDDEEPRIESRWILGGGQPVLVAREWRVLTRGTHDGLPTRIARKERAASPSAVFGGEGNAVSEVVTFVDEGADTPPLLRGAEISRLREDGVRVETAWTLANGVLRSVSREFAGGVGAKTARVEERDAVHGVVTYTADMLAENEVEFGWERRVYDDQNRLRSVAYADGSHSTNVYSCCRLLSSTDRTGFTTLRSATTGRDRLYYAEEETSLKSLPKSDWACPDAFLSAKYAGSYRVVQHFMDALGRETNSVTRCAYNPGEAVAPDFQYSRGWRNNATVSYPDGVSDHVVSVDKRGLVTERTETVLADRVETVVCEFPTVASATPDVVSTNISYLGGGTVAFRATETNWTERASFTEWGGDGQHSEVETTRTSDGAFFTNRVVRYDFLGRVAEDETPLSRVVRSYAGSSSRVVSTLDERSGIGTVPLYDDFGEEIGETRDGVERRTDVSFEELSNAWWHVETTTVSKNGVTNSSSAVWTRLTGLSDEVRSQSFREEDGVRVSSSSASFDPVALVETIAEDSPLSGCVEVGRMFGREISRLDRTGSECDFFDPWGNLFYVERAWETSRRPVEAFDRDAMEDVVKHTVWHASIYGGRSEETRSYNSRGDLTNAVDFVGSETGFARDSGGRATETSGDGAHPLRQGFDALGHRVLLATTRDGEIWDPTRWTIDAATGLTFAKTYVDGSFATNTYAADGIPLRATLPSGKWKENAYDAIRRLSSVVSSDGALDAGFEYDAFSRLSSASNAASFIDYSRDGRGNATNETCTSDGMMFTLTRSYDAYGRIIGRAGTPCPPSSDGGVATTAIADTSFTYRPDGLIESVSNADAVVSYLYDNHAQDIGYELTLPSGMTFSRQMTRNIFRRERIQSVSNSCGEVAWVFAYGYDALSRPTFRTLTGSTGISPVASSFSYNTRGEVASASIGEHDEVHEYDLAGNSITAAYNFITNDYTANNLNQYTSVGRRVPTPPPATSISHDIDGNLTNCAPWSFTWDSGNRLTAVSSNGIQIAAYAYDTFGRRVKKATAASTTYFFYDGWNLVREVEVSGNITNVVEYVWGKDLSGSFQGAGGVGGLLYEKCNGAIYIPYQDAFGNIMGYWDTNGVIVAEYTYDAFGKIISQSGTMADVFRHRFSTKYYDSETGFYYYGYRYYFPELLRWLSRDPLEEEGGENLYLICSNDLLGSIDWLGLLDVNVETIRENNIWQRILNNGDKYSYISVKNVDDISVKNGLNSKSINGLFAQMMNVGDCSVTIVVNIYLNDRLIEDSDQGIVHYYEPHSIKNDVMIGGIASTSNGSPQLRNGVLSHEKGHASAFLNYTIPLFRQRLNKFGCRRLSSEEKNEVRRIYEECIRSTLQESAESANKAQEEWYKKRRKRFKLK